MHDQGATWYGMKMEETMATSIQAKPAAAGFGSVSVPLKITGTVTIVVGIVFIVVAMMNSLFQVGPAFEDMITDFRPVLTDASLDTARADLAVLDAAGEEFTTIVAPGMAQALGLAPEEFSAMMESQYPDVVVGMAALPAITESFSGLVDTLDSQQALFASADAIPTNDLPANTVPWIITIAGVAAVIVGVLMFKPGRMWAALAVGLGAALVLTTFALSLPQKAADADELNANLTPIYTQELIDGANASLGIVGAMGVQMQEEMLPDLAAQLNMTMEELGGFMAENFPATATAMNAMGDSLPRFEAFVGVFAANLDNYQTIQPVAFTPIIWMMIVGGGLILAMGAFCLATKR
ncbi:MAG: hypothetical protein M3132_01630 [Actinomycetia bacterium]|nr:hypothetical protein [Actinomycetes bacterium]